MATNHTQMIYEFGAFRLDERERLLLRAGERVAIKPKLFDLLLTLVQRAGHLVEKEELMRRVWVGTVVEENSLAVGIFALRKILGGPAQRPTYIETVPSRGYRFTAAVHASNENSAHGHQFLVRADTDESHGREIESIAVLPFRVIGIASEEIDYLGIGLADTLITKLGSIGRVTVRPTNATLKHVDQDPRQAGMLLRVGTVLAGTVQRVSEQIRITVQLVSVADDRTLWTGKFDGDLHNVFQLEDEIAARVADAFTATLSADERLLLRKRFTESKLAYQAFMKGRYLFSKNTPNDVWKSVAYFEDALQMDPTFALAHSAIAGAYLQLFYFHLISPQEMHQKVEASVLRALELDNSLTEPRIHLSTLRMFNWDLSAAIETMKEVLAISPNNTMARRQYSVFLRHDGRFDEAIAEIKRAHELEPASRGIELTLGNTYHFARQYALALRTFESVLQLDSNYIQAIFSTGLTYDATGRHEEALKAFRKANALLDSNNPEVLASIARALAMSGQKRTARQIRTELCAKSKSAYVPAYYIALIDLALGKKDEALAWLELGFRNHDSEMMLLKVDPRMDLLRDDRRFINLLGRLGL